MELRWSSWKTILLSNQNVISGLYESLISEKSDSESQILKDITRTFPQQVMFNSSKKIEENIGHQ